MYSVGRIGLFILFCVLPISTVVSLPVRWDVTCMMGTYYSRESYLPCSKGYFQDEQGHINTQCKPWTYKSPSLHFVIKTPGTQTHDIDWTCPEDYELFRYTPGEYECRKIATIPHTTITNNMTSETMEITTESKPVEIVSTTISSLSGRSSSQNLPIYPYFLNYVMVFSAIVVVIVVLVFIIAKAYKKITSPKKKSEINFSFFHKIIYQLGKDSDAFVNHLQDPSEKLIFDSSVYFQQKKGRNLIDAYTRACLQWVKENKKYQNQNDIKQYIVQALKAIGRHDVITDNQLTAETSPSTPLVTGDN